MPYTPLANSTVLDAFASGQFNDAQYQAVLAGSSNAGAVLADLFGSPGEPASISVATSGFVTVGLVLNRANDPTALLSSSWATRQAQLADQAAVWATYGADAATYGAVYNAVKSVVGEGALSLATAMGYVSSVEDRTVWVTLTPGEFQALLGVTQLDIREFDAPAWTGNLGINDLIPAGAIGGVWLEANALPQNPMVFNSTPVPVSAGPLGIANGAALSSSVIATPTAIADNYRFPLPADVDTPTIALIESNITGSGGESLRLALNQYRAAIGLPPVTEAEFQTVPAGAQANQLNGEVTLDVSVIAGAAPNSTQILYGMQEAGTPYLAYQRAIFDAVNDPGILSSSYGIYGQPTAASPFQWAFQQLFVDAALANVSVHVAAGDLGAAGYPTNGVPNVISSQSATYALLVGGTAIATLSTALEDPTLASLVSLALVDNTEIVFSLVAAGLKTLPSHLDASAPGPAGAASSLTTLVEAVWQTLVVQQAGNQLEAPFGSNETGSGGVATYLPVPAYQSRFGLNPTGPSGSGRGAPDVSALSAGDSYYGVLNDAYVDGQSGASLLTLSGGTSASAPLWAALTAQFNTIFADQGLPRLGFYNDLLYNAAVVAPGSFNDILLGNNVNSYFTTDHDTGFTNMSGQPIVPTGMGYAAGPGYDLATGLGTPNGLLLGRALTAIAHAQVSFSSSPALLDDDGNGGWQSGADQSLLFQVTSPGGDASIDVSIGAIGTPFFSGASGSFAWTSRLAQQSLQADFDPGLVTLFDKQAQGAVSYSGVALGQAVALTVDGASGQALQASYSNPYGFADFFAGGDSVRVARPIAIAETVGGANDQLAVVRLRQGGQDSLSLTLYKVDDLAGSIDGLAPGTAGYNAAIAGRAYQTTAGDTAIAGPGYGQYAQVMLQNVDAGDMIAMKLTDQTTGAFFFAFANANETVNGQAVGHLWNYGLNTWGWEDTFGGGDRDYNDLVVQLDFTSASGHGWLV
ncbi:DUF4114 domain-containing protein [Reyranella sp.]|uniref:DUF4114 domain-containing protein n=1 Tax=Reyranella sp. TaxID=1929291 RepID=UPI003BAD4784